ncbi:MAG: sugar phosphate isomerase/epimerase family protein [Armatimonadota bacterium]
MEIGLLTAPLSSKPLDYVVNFAKANGFQALEVASGPGSKHLDTSALSKSDLAKAKDMLAKAGVRISSLAWYTNLLDPDEAKRKQLSSDMRKVIDAAAALGVEVVCTMAGMAMPGKSKMQTIEQDLPGVLKPLVDYAAGQSIKIAFENWYATNLQNLAHWQRVFEVVPAPNLGLNFDPSHLHWQGIDYLAAVDEFRARIFHTHAKDVEIKQHVLQRLGNQSDGWWRYCIPGYGEINWGVYIARLKDSGYDGVLSIEHEDRAFGAEDGFIKGQRQLAQWV